ncbi:MAG: pantoate--beta-alanine ligase [Gammaproteobacteria bacterium]|uniref:pantoate--beta-alanine ligase n=1 Tax=Pseudomaricurvus alcaniphilus TaxID=1166482 RepID=UPI00140CF946|nr:pantoate--beta-alanine ligase [Pseudomaricurvus alcaniphilus]MBR9910761.1 pantoate--beta-alanine ligase [Gammaproteobacteria bacterium]NHN39100.1 pantoate--beta-alanine ligase [Pseudomaricurvus alcaniphilus]
MQIHHHITPLREALRGERLAGKRIGFVPTMGNLHRGHISLIERARQSNDVVVCSIFVNGLQFGKNEDLDKYPRTFQDDCDKLAAAGCDYVFHPDDREMYPNGMEAQTRVICPVMTDVLCGASRPGHFEGVTTVVTKLFNIVQPDEAVFGSKDYQQLAVIRRMAADLCMPVQITAGETLREADGLAMSSRNGFITPAERPRVVQLNQSLNWAVDQIRAGRKDFDRIQREACQQIEQAGFKVDYFAIMNSDSLRPAAAEDQRITLLGAMFVTGARLIDNVSVTLS